jgi:pyruvate dehydrogenase E1 component alpha subunit
MTRMEKVTATTEMYRRGEAYVMPSTRVDGNDCFALHEAAVEAVARARRGDGPSFVEAMTYRWREHAEGLEVLFAGLRDQAEIDEWIARDPVARHEATLTANGVARSAIDQLHAELDAEIAAAVEFARSSPEPAPEEAFTDLWVEA